MKTTMNFFKMGLLVLAMVLTSCSAEDGADGGMGPQGIAGTDGADGADGQDGTNGVAGQDGEDGNANIFFSDRFFPNWNEIDNPRHKRMIIENPNFSKVINGGGVVVFMYWSTNNGTTFALPRYDYFSSGAIRTSKDFILRGNNELWLTIRKYGSDFTPSETEGTVGTITYNRLRYIIVPSGALVGKSSLDFTDYEAVKAFYNIPD